MKDSLYQLRFPIGEFTPPEKITANHHSTWISTIEQFPSRLAKLLETVSEDQLNWRYRPDGWTILQVIHHCSDSHVNCLIRFKLALTEENPTIKPYDEAKWADLPDYILSPSVSMEILKAVHFKLSTLLHNMTEDEFKRTYFHPEHQSSFELNEILGMYAWHCDHHFAHIQQALASNGIY